MSLPKEYRDLAKLRVETRWPDYQQPEDFGYDFRDWVSPYTKTACRLGSVAVVLQDWASADGLRGGPDADIQQYGRTPRLRTNRMLDSLLRRVFGLSSQRCTQQTPFHSSSAVPCRTPFLLWTSSRPSSYPRRLNWRSLVRRSWSLPAPQRTRRCPASALQAFACHSSR